jgi:hypothetical protein
MDASKSASATFTQITYTLGVSVAGSGKVTSLPAGIDCGATCNASFNSGTAVILTAMPISGWMFQGWGGACSGVGPCSLTMSGNQSVSATFVPITYTLAVSVAGSGKVTSSPAGIDCGATCNASFNSGTAVTLTATPISGWAFQGWSGACSGTGTCSLTMSGNRNVSAAFVPITYTLAVSVGQGGTVTSSPAGIDCGAACSASFNSGTPVTLTATPVSGWVFQGWGGACSGTGTCSLTMNADQSVSASFSAAIYTLSVTVAGSPGSRVASSSSAIDCGSTCSANFTAGTQVTLIAIPDNAWGLAGWGGACSGIGGCTVTMNADTSVSAAFATLFMPVEMPLVGLPTDDVLPPPIIGPE